MNKDQNMASSNQRSFMDYPKRIVVSIDLLPGGKMENHKIVREIIDVSNFGDFEYKLLEVFNKYKYYTTRNFGSFCSYSFDKVVIGDINDYTNKFELINIDVLKSKIICNSSYLDFVYR